MNSAISFRVSGRVQGVGFRAFVRSTGQQFGLTGWVRNEIDGTVSGYAEGDQGLMNDFIKTIQIGNRWSSVKAVNHTTQSYSGEFESFEIRY